MNIIAAAEVTGIVYVLVKVLVICIVAAVIWWALSMIPMQNPLAQIVRVIFILIVVLILLAILLPLLGVAL